MTHAEKELFLKALRHPVLKKDWGQRPQSRAKSKTSIFYLCSAAAIMVGLAIGVYLNGGAQ